MRTPSRRLAAPLLAVLLVVPAPVGADEAEGMSSFDWSGPHLGVFGIYSHATLRGNGNRAAIGRDDDDVLLGGVSGGYRWNLPHGLVGNLMLEVPLTGNSDGTVDTLFFPAPAFVPPVRYEYDLNWAFFVTGQLGYAFGRTLPFVEFGAGPASMTYRVFNVAGAGTYSPGAVQKATNTHIVWKIGIGVDHAFTDSIIGGLKLNYFRADNRRYEVPWNAPGPNYMGAHGFAIQATLGWKF